MSAVLAVTDLDKAYGGVHAVRGVSFSVAAGEMLALIGPNGAGKSTCFNMLNGQIRPDAGKVSLLGRDITGMKPRAVWRLGVGRTFQITATFGSMTVRENVQMALLSHHRGLMDVWRPATSRYAAEATTLLERVGMQAQLDRPCGVLAYGDLKRVELAIALANAPKLLLMDEPTAGMAPGERISLMDLTARIAKQSGIAVLFTEHDMDVVFAHADRLMVLNRGQLIAQGSPAEIRADPMVREVYLGTGHTAGGALMLSVTGLGAHYGRAHILEDVALDVGAGEVVVLLGRNGAGKSTTMKAIMGLVPPTAGRVDFRGENLAGMLPHSIARAGIGYVPEDRRIFAELTVLENLEVGRKPAPPGQQPWTPDRLFALFPSLGAMRKRPGGRMSGGEQQMLTIARTLMGNPRLVLLDEPSEGLAPVIVERMAAAILTLKAEGLSILLSEQNLHFAQYVSDRATIIEKGRIRWNGSILELVAAEAVRAQYLSV